ncbi:MAG: amino acid permease [Gemmatimonadetes bacterium]|nr:amino acid permease [Gemmatimonadota bacterium]
MAQLPLQSASQAPQGENPASTSSTAAAGPGIPRPTLEVADAVALTVGIVIGAGIFKTPALVAASAGSEALVLLAWALGGGVSVIGALCYAELATTYPNAGGDYHYLSRAYGPHVGFLFAWARLGVIQTGSIALLAFIFGDYASRLFYLGTHSSAVYAGLAVVGLTALNAVGVRESKRVQKVLTTTEVFGLFIIAMVGLVLVTSPAESAQAPLVHPSGGGSFGTALVLVLLTYGGWSEAAYVSAEVRQPERNMLRTLLLSIGLITALYLLVNLAYLRGLGLVGVARSDAVAADLMERAFGGLAPQIISLLIAVSALTSANTTVFTGARTGYALGRDFPSLAWLGRWNERVNTPTNALLAQAGWALALVVLGTLARGGFETMVSYTAPVFWLFFMLSGFSVIVLRHSDPSTPRPFRVPGYPLTPLFLSATSAYLLYSSVAYTGIGALVGAGVLGIGGALLVFIRLKRRYPQGDGVRGDGHAE